MLSPANLSFAIAWYALNRGRWTGRLMTGIRPGGAPDDALAIDSKTMKNALDEAGHQTHIMHYIIDWNYNEDRSRIHTGFGPENITRLRHFAVGILKSFQITNQSVAELMRTLCFRR